MKKGANTTCGTPNTGSDPGRQGNIPPSNIYEKGESNSNNIYYPTNTDTVQQTIKTQILSNHAEHEKLRTTINKVYSHKILRHY